MTHPPLKPSSVGPHIGLVLAKMRFTGRYPMFFPPESTT